ncbi:rhomboid family intramembrane serine protease [Weeksellaceae bacterium KMM 9713]|uniref:Rhomboid family intramembrane serine protease n=1 Tax=Profundicola chukchiensis TaxID=2961959 RepID=A0A9X4MU35_9FLAO|nr:rhomboid family intramembrane serine protease [Profundicola chukchiensis]MDG4944873.1 rhomboid family intramembrane serine protease [Profundicola chukchiensis]
MGGMNITMLIIIGITVLVSWQGWQNRELFERLKFQMGAILEGKQYDRMITSAFLHADSMHLLFNMFAFYVFAPVVLSLFSSLTFVLIYLVSILAGSLVTILFHGKEKWYSAVGASGGVSGVVFSAIMIYPDMPLRLIFLPFFDFPGWAFALVYLGYSMFGMKSRHDNVGHAAHLGGSIAGIAITLGIKPELINQLMNLF